VRTVCRSVDNETRVPPIDQAGSDLMVIGRFASIS
jgi:hypothetical protein